MLIEVPHTSKCFDEVCMPPTLHNLTLALGEMIPPSRLQQAIGPTEVAGRCAAE
jgi:hypothetical protein